MKPVITQSIYIGHNVPEALAVSLWVLAFVSIYTAYLNSWEGFF